MKILHISTSDNGGAGLAALRIHKSLLCLGCNSKMLVADKSSQLDTIYVVKENLNLYHWSSIWLFRKFQKFVLRKLGFVTKIEKYEAIVNSIPLEQRVFFTFPITHYDLSEHPLVKEADIIHLHWIANFVDYETFFKKVNKPIVWTFHDENIGLGGFHYTKTSQGYSDYYKNIEEEFCKIKKQALIGKTNITSIALSKMMVKFCADHSFLKENPVYIINNGVDNLVYRPQNKEFARSVFNIPINNLVLAFCSVSLQDERKGLKELIKALEILSISNITLLCIGNGNISSTTKINTVCVGQIQNENIISLLYSCADMFVIPSFQESFGQTTIEAMSCGVPVVTFPCGIAQEIINDTNGVVCSDFTVPALVEGIQKALSIKYNPDAIRQNIINHFSSKKIANEYISVYNHVLEQK